MPRSPVSVRNASVGDIDAINDLWTRSRTAYHQGFVPEEVLSDPARAARRREGLVSDLESPDHAVLCAPGMASVWRALR